LSRDLNDVTKAAIRQARKKDRCPFCGEIQYDIDHEKPTTYYEVQQVLTSEEYSQRIAGAMAMRRKGSTGRRRTNSPKKPRSNSRGSTRSFSGSFRPREPAKGHREGS